MIDASEKTWNAARPKFISGVGNSTRRETRLLIEIQNGSFPMHMTKLFLKTTGMKLIYIWPILLAKLVRNQFESLKAVLIPRKVVQEISKFKVNENIETRS